MKIILGIPDTRIPVWELGTPLMINQLYWSEVPWINETWVDSGGYQIMIRGISVRLEEVIKRYKAIEAEVFMSLDIPSNPCEKINNKNFENFEYLYTKLDKKIIPVIHAYNPDDLDKATDYYRFYSDIIAYGGIIPPSLERNGSKKLAILIYHYLRKKITKIHVLGAGSPFMRRIFFNSYSVDTTTYRIKAIHGMVILPGKGERYVGSRKIVWNSKRITQEEIEELYRFLEVTKYPFPIDIQNWKSRTLINAWITIHSDYNNHNHSLIKFSEKISKTNSNEIRELIYEECKKLMRKF
jgi:hypothetical protein